MLIEKRMQKILDKLSATIQVHVDILDMNGTIISSSEKDHIGMVEPFLKEEANTGGKNSFIYKGKTYVKFAVDKTIAYYLAIEGTGKVIRNYCLLIASLLEVYLKPTNQKMDREGTVRRVLLGQVSDLELQELIKDFKIQPEIPRCIFVIQTETMDASQIYHILQKAFPRSQGDFLVLMDSKTVALIKDISEGMDEEELMQMAEAIEETVINETSLKIRVGIGRSKESLYNIGESYEEALKSIRIGSIYDPEKNVYMYDLLLLERFLYEVPLEISEKYYQSIFHEDLKKILNDEMIATIEKFFENSLNLSETARQLYIHRNTLVYRLDKIQKVLGLDLRNFHDAVTFKIMMMLERQRRECCN